MALPVALPDSGTPLQVKVAFFSATGQRPHRRITRSGGQPHDRIGL
jgi:hypothetical protein